MLLRCWRCWFFLYTSNFKKEMSFEISLTSTHPTLAEHSIWEELHIQSSGSEDGTNSEEQSSQQGSQQQGSQQQGSEESDEPMQQAVFFYSTSDAIGTQYVMQFSATEQPAVVGIQGDIVSNGWTWDGGSNLLTITLELVDFGQNTDFGVEGIEGKNVIAIGFIAAAKNNGPPPEATGMWMATNVLDWRMKPPGKDGRFGVVLYGPDGHTGFFKMYIPNA